MQQILVFVFVKKKNVERKISAPSASSESKILSITVNRSFRQIVAVILQFGMVQVFERNFIAFECISSFELRRLLFNDGERNRKELH